MKIWIKSIISMVSMLVVGIVGQMPAMAAETVIVPTEHQILINETEQLASSGRAINSENFAVGSKGSEIRSQWGKPDSDSSSKDVYTYRNRRVDFFLTNDVVTHVVSYDQRFEEITYAEVKQVLGDAAEETKGDDAVYLTYNCGKKLLLFTFAYDEDKNPDTISQVIVSSQYARMAEFHKR